MAETTAAVRVEQMVGQWANLMAAHWVGGKAVS